MKPSITIEFHDGYAPMELVMYGLRHALHASYDIEFLEEVTTTAASGVAGFLLRLHLRPLPIMVQDAGKVRAKSMERANAHCDLLDGLNVPNGEKSIAVALHAHWSKDHQARFGNAANPLTVKRWRTERSSRRRGDVVAIDSRDVSPTSGRQVSRIVRRHHAIRCNASGGQMRHQYRQALAELDAVNSGRHASYGKPSVPIPSFSYETFRRDCRSAGNGGCEQPVSRRRRRRRTSA